MALITARDLALIEWIARFPFVTSHQASKWLSSIAHGSPAMRVLNRRTAVLIDAGLLADGRLLTEHGRVFWVTHEGLAAVGVTGQVHPPRIGQARHDKLVTDLALDLMISKASHQLVTEREMRREDTRNQLPSNEPVWVTVHTSAKSRRVYPDLLTVAPSGSRVVHEVELASKAHSRLVSLMLSHLDNNAVGGVRYYAANDARTGVEKAAEVARQAAAQRGNRKVLTVLGLPG